MVRMINSTDEVDTKGRKKAAILLSAFTKAPAVRSSIHEYDDGLRELVSRVMDTDLCEHVSKILMDMAFPDSAGASVSGSLIQKGILDNVAHVLAVGTAESKFAALGILVNMAIGNEYCKSCIVQNADIPAALVSCIAASNTKHKVLACSLIKSLSRCDTEPGALKSPSPASNVAATDKELRCKRLCDAGLLPALIGLIEKYRKHDLVCGALECLITLADRSQPRSAELVQVLLHMSATRPDTPYL